MKQQQAGDLNWWHGGKKEKFLGEKRVISRRNEYSSRHMLGPE